MIVACPSYRRAGAVTTMRCFPEGHLIVPESQRAEYEEAGTPDGWQVVAIPDEQDGNIARKRNSILDMYAGEDVVMVDDDYTRMVRTRNGGQQHTMEHHEVAFMLEQGFTLARGFATPLWGVNLNSDWRHYYEFRPFSTVGIVLGPFTAVTAERPTDLRYEERLAPKEDYDFCLQVLHRYHCVVRMNMYSYLCDHVSKPGGIVSQRTMESEVEKGKMLQRKWGSRVVGLRFGYAKAGESGQGQKTAHMDPSIRVPLGGV